MKRLLDRQFDECDLTMRDLELIQSAMIKTVTSIYHGRIAYPPAAGIPDAAANALMSSPFNSISRRKGGSRWYRFYKTRRRQRYDPLAPARYPS